MDIWEPRGQKLIIRGTATDTVDADPEKLARKINKMVEKMVEEFYEGLEDAEKQ